MIAAIYARKMVPVIGLAMLVLVVAAPRSDAECAWVLWKAPYVGPSGSVRPEWTKEELSVPVNGYSSKKDCEAGAAAWSRPLKENEVAEEKGGP